MRRLLIVVAALAVAGGAAVAVLGRDPSGPFPPAAELRFRGFAAWPVDTVEEAEAECATPEGWRLDARATALRFARQILRYPEPHAGDASGEQVHRARLLIGSDATRDLFLGSVLELARFGRCWYVTGGAPREGDVLATLGFVYRDGRPHLLLGHFPVLPEGFVGYGDWETEIEGGARQTVTWMPELEPGATGHAIYTRPDARGVSESVGVRTLGHVPPPPEGPPAEPLGVADVVDDPEVCRIDSSPSRSPERLIRYLYEWTFDDLLEQVDGYARYERRGFRHLGGDRWRLVVDDAVLIARIPEIAGRCYKLVSMRPAGTSPPLRRLWVGDEAVTFELDWREGDEATVAAGTASAGLGGTLERIDERVTFPRDAEPPPAGVPTYARVVLYEKGHVVSAYYGLFGGD